MITQHTATDIRHRTICHISASKRRVIAAAAAAASGTQADEDDRNLPSIWAASLVETIDSNVKPQSTLNAKTE